jgi:hypothetical protein
MPVNPSLVFAIERAKERKFCGWDDLVMEMFDYSPSEYLAVLEERRARLEREPKS